VQNVDRLNVRRRDHLVELGVEGMLIKDTDCEEIRRERVDFIELAQDRVQSRAFVNMAMNLRVA
jgi:hypothetical protein